MIPDVQGPDNSTSNEETCNSYCGTSTKCYRPYESFAKVDMNLLDLHVPNCLYCFCNFNQMYGGVLYQLMVTYSSEGWDIISSRPYVLSQVLI
jgi:hypothetical protein